MIATCDETAGEVGVMGVNPGRFFFFLVDVEGVLIPDAGKYVRELEFLQSRGITTHDQIKWAFGGRRSKFRVTMHQTLDYVDAYHDADPTGAFA